MRTAPEPARLLPLITALAEHDLDFVVIGGAAGSVYGSSYPTYDLDVAVAPGRKNVEVLNVALRALAGTLSAPTRTGKSTYDTSLGRLDVFARPPGAPPYDRLKKEAVGVQLQSYTVRVASLDHLIAMKEAAGRTKDKLMATEYRVLADEQRRLRDLRP